MQSAGTSVIMDENDENPAVCEKHGLSELETKLMESVAAGVPQDGTPAYFEYSTSDKFFGLCIFTYTFEAGLPSITPSCLTRSLVRNL